MFATIVKVGRTHLQDATPVTLGQEFSGYAAQIGLGASRIHRALSDLMPVAQGGTAVGTGLNAKVGFAEAFAKRLAEATNLPFVTAPNKFEALASHDALAFVHGALNSAAVGMFKIANDVRLLGSGPRCGIGELVLPENEPGSSIMPGKVNPTQAEAMTMVCAQVFGNQTIITVAGSQGHFELNVFKPVIAAAVLQSIRLLGDAATSLPAPIASRASRRVRTVSGRAGRSIADVGHGSRATKIGYDLAAKIAKAAHANKTTLREEAVGGGYVTNEEFDAVVRPENMIGPGFEALLAKADAAPLVAYAAPVVKPWTHTDFGAAGQIAERTEVADLGLTLARFANGVRLTVKPIKASPGQVEVLVRFGHGRLDQPRDRLDASDWSTILMQISGLSDLTTSDIPRTLVGHPVAMYAKTEDEAFTVGSLGLFSQSVPSADLELEMQYLAATMTSPGWRSDGWKTLLVSTAQDDRASEATPDGVFSHHVAALLHPGRSALGVQHRGDARELDARAGAGVHRADPQAIEPRGGRGWRRDARSGDRRRCEDLWRVAEARGPAGAARRARRGLSSANRDAGRAAPRGAGGPGHRRDQLADHRPLRRVERHRRERDPDRRAEAAGDRPAAHRRRRNLFAARRRRLCWCSRAWAASPYMLVPCKPESIGRVYAIDIAADLAAHPISADELQRAVRPEVEGATRSQQQNGYWIFQLAGAQTDPRRLDYIRQTLPQLSGVTSADVQRVAVKWLRADRAFRIEVTPKPSPPAPAAVALSGPAPSR